MAGILSGVTGAQLAWSVWISGSASRAASAASGLSATGGAYDGHPHPADPAAVDLAAPRCRWSSKSTASPASGSRPSRAMRKPATVS